MEKLINCYFCDKEIKLKDSNNSHYIKGRLCSDCNKNIEIPLRIIDFETYNENKNQVDIKRLFIENIIVFLKENKGEILNEKKYKEFLNKRYNLNDHKR